MPDVSDPIAERNKQAVHKLFTALSGKTPDYETVRSMFAPDAIYWAITPISPHRVGPDAIVDDLKRQLALAGDLESMEPYALVASGNHVVLERTDFVTVAHTGYRGGIRICSVFEFNDGGQLTGWREYFDKAYCEKQLGFGGSDYSSTPAPQ